MKDLPKKLSYLNKSLERFIQELKDYKKTKKSHK